MKKELLDILCCPMCKGSLTLEVKRQSKDEITAGTLTCQKCASKFPIEEGIPNMLPPELR